MLEFNLDHPSECERLAFLLYALQQAGVSFQVKNEDCNRYAKVWFEK